MRGLKILLDTQFLIWILFEPDKLKKQEIELLSDYENEVVYSPISLFEISLKYSYGKLEIRARPGEIPKLLEAAGFEVAYPSLGVFSTVNELTKEEHRDPFDRLLIWQAISDEFHFLSRDRKMPLYQKHGLKLI